MGMEVKSGPNSLSGPIWASEVESDKLLGWVRVSLISYLNSETRSKKELTPTDIYYVPIIRFVTVLDLSGYAYG